MQTVATGAGNVLGGPIAVPKPLMTQVTPRLKDILETEFDHARLKASDGKATKGNSVPWGTKFTGVLADAKNALDGKGVLTKDRLIKKAIDLIHADYGKVAEGSGTRVSPDDLRALYKRDTSKARVLAQAYTQVTQQHVDLKAKDSTPAPAKAAAVEAPDKGWKAAPKTEAKTRASRRASEEIVEEPRTRRRPVETKVDRPNRAAPKVVVDNAPISEAITKIFAKTGAHVSGSEMNKVLNGLAKQGISAENVADQLIKGQGPVARLLSADPTPGQHGLTMDALNTLILRLQNGMPTKPLPGQAKAYIERVDGLTQLVTPRLTTLDWDTAQSYSNIPPDLMAQAQAAVGGDGVLTKKQYSGLTGVFRQAADHIFSFAGGAARITAPLLALTAGQIMMGLPLVAGMPLLGAAAMAMMAGRGGGGGGLPMMAAGALPLAAGALPMVAAGGGSLLSMGMQVLLGGVLPRGGAGTLTPFGIPFNLSNWFGSSNMVSMATTLQNGWIPTGNNMFDLANCVANAPVYSTTEQKLLNAIEDPKQRAMQALQMQMQKQALLATMLTNLANMRHEMLKAVANNFRA